MTSPHTFRLFPKMSVRGLAMLMGCLPVVGFVFGPRGDVNVTSRVHADDPPANTGKITNADSAAKVRQVIDKALPAVVRGGNSWIENKDCLSCHRVAFTTWALNSASDRGLNVDETGHRRIADWSVVWQNMANPKRRAESTREDTLQGESDTVAQLLLGQPAARNSDAPAEWVAVYRDNLVKARQAEGFWKPTGQLPLQKRSLRETQEVTTAWVLLALAETATGDGVDDTLLKASREWLGTETQGESTEWWATRLLLERTLGTETAADELRKSLLQRQRDDGGWGWLSRDNSDALGTSLALYALAKDGVPLDDPAVQRAVEFLKSTQKPDGSWPVPGTKKASAKRVTETASYWGTSWAVIALAEFLPHPAPRQAEVQRPASGPLLANSRPNRSP